MRIYNLIASMVLALSLSACGGGGGNSGTPLSGSTNISDSGDGSQTPVAKPPVVTLLLKNSSGSSVSSVSSTDIFTLQASVTSAAGSPLSGQVVRFSGESALVQFSSANSAALTDTLGIATVQVSPGTSGGAGYILADITVDGVAAEQASLGLTVIPVLTGGSATAKIAMFDSSSAATTAISALETNTLKATVKNASGNSMPGQIVQFSSLNGLVKFMPASSALTDIGGVATVTVLRSQTSSVGADTVSASASVGGVAVTPAELNIYVNKLASGGIPTLSLGLRDSSNASTTTVARTGTTTAYIQLTDATGAIPSPTTVTLSGDADIINFPSGATTLSDASGIARIPVSVVAASPGGASTLRVSASISGSQVSSSLDFQVPAGAASGLPILTLGLADGGSSVAAAGTTVAKATIKDASGLAVASKLVTFAGNTALIKFSPASGSVLTDANGVASIQVSPTSLTSAGASTLTAQATVGTASLTSSFDFQLSAANLGLQPLDLGAGAGVAALPLSSYGNRAISVKATVNGVPATNTPVQVTFTTSCGSVTPSIVTTDATGAASSTYTASSASCSGNNVVITASAVGAASSSGTIPVSAPIATNVQFVSTTPQLIYLKDSVGTTQAQVVFKVVDSNGNPLQNKTLRLSLSNSASGVGLDTVGNTAAVQYTTDSAGLVSAAVFSGTVPTSLTVKAELVENIAVFSNSNLLTVASGRPTQSSLSLTFGKLSIEGASVDGISTNVTLNMADRQGNPVPPGTQVNFVTEAGVMLPAVCFVPPVIPETASSAAIPVSSCSVSISSSGTRTSKGLVSVLAYVAGEEDFVDDGDGNNSYDSGERFTDLGRAFRDDNGTSLTGKNGVYDAGEFQVPRDGAAACTAATGCVGDGVWGAADVRSQRTIVFATSAASITTSSLIATTPRAGSTGPVNTLNGVTFTVSDLNGNSMPTGTSVGFAALDDGLDVPGVSGAKCELISSASFTIPNTLFPITIGSLWKNCTAGDAFQVTVTSPLGAVTQSIFTVQ